MFTFTEQISAFQQYCIIFQPYSVSFTTSTSHWVYEKTKYEVSGIWNGKMSLRQHLGNILNLRASDTDPDQSKLPELTRHTKQTKVGDVNGES